MPARPTCCAALLLAVLCAPALPACRHLAAERRTTVVCPDCGLKLERVVRFDGSSWTNETRPLPNDRPAATPAAPGPERCAHRLRQTGARTQVHLESLERPSRSLRRKLAEAIESGSPEERELALIIAGYTNDADLAPHAVSRLNDPDPAISAAAAGALARLYDRSFLEEYARLSRDARPEVRLMGVAGLGRQIDPTLPAHAAKLAEQGVPDERAAGLTPEERQLIRATKLRLLRPDVDGRTVGVLLPRLEDEDLSVREEAIRVLGDLAAVEAIAPLAPLYANTSSLPRLREAARLALEQILAEPAAQGQATELARSGAGLELRVLAVNRLAAQPPGGEVDRALGDLLADGEPEVRLAAVRALGRRADERLGRLFAARLPAEDSRRVLVALAEELALRPAPEAAAPLVDLNNRFREVGGGGVAVRLQATLALAEIGGPVAVGGLLERLTDAAAEVRRAAARGLRRHGDASAVPPLVAALAAEQDDEAAAAIIWALEAFGGREVLEPLARALAEDRPLAGKAAAESLRRMTGQDFHFFPYDTLPRRRRASELWTRWIARLPATFRVIAPERRLPMPEDFDIERRVLATREEPGRDYGLED